MVASAIPGALTLIIMADSCSSRLSLEGRAHHLRITDMSVGLSRGEARPSSFWLNLAGMYTDNLDCGKRYWWCRVQIASKSFALRLIMSNPSSNQTWRSLRLSRRTGRRTDGSHILLII